MKSHNYSRLTMLDRYLFNQYPICWPFEDKLTIITGINSGGKTKLLESMSDYFTEQHEYVLYFPVDRQLNIDFYNFKMAWDKLDSLNIMNRLSESDYDYDFTQKWSIDMYTLEVYLKMHQYTYINTGLYQAINFVVNIMNSNHNNIVMIDMPEKNLDMYKKRSILNDLLILPNVKKLIVVTHSPEIISNHMEYTWDIAELCDILKERRESK